MPDLEPGGPWQPKVPPKSQGSSFGLMLWVGLIVLAGFGIWRLSDLFPGQIASDGDRAYLIQAVAILAFLSSGLIFARRVNFGEVARNIAIWVAVAAVLVIGLSYRSEIEAVALRVRAELVPGYGINTEPGVFVLTESANGHFYAMGDANGVRVRFLVDTGATDTVLSPADAERLGIDLKALDYGRVYGTANGVGRGAPFILSRLTVGPIELSDVPVSINEAEMDTSLLGMSFLRRLQSFEIKDRRLYLRSQ
jgi:aspartyl protease family protein